jgi:formamidopyrimidine-DNA glycosylase
MPELPDVLLYLDALDRFVVGHVLEEIRVRSPSLLKTVDPPLAEAAGRRVAAVERIGKRIVLSLEGELFLVLHLMIAGRLRWREAGKKPPGKLGQAEFAFAHGSLWLTEAGTKKRASLHLVRGRDALPAFDRGGLDVRGASLEEFRHAITRERHTLRRTLTDPRLLDGIGNAYADEIMHRARLSPVQLSTNLDDAEVARLYEASRAGLDEWTTRLREENGEGFPEKVTAFREGMAVHGRFREPCPACGSPVQRIRWADNETNYCARCQTGGRLLAVRALSRLLREDWPKKISD